MKDLINASWLKENFDDKDLIILDCSEKSNVNAKTVNNPDLKIKGARFFDLNDRFSDTKSSLPHTFPSPTQFEEEAQKIGTNSNSKIVVYDNLGLYVSPRAWWMFKVMGHENIAVLDGGLDAWIKAGGESEKNNFDEHFERGNFHADPSHNVMLSKQDVLQNIDSKKRVLIDARSKGRFDGTAPEPREGIPSGHVPGSKNLPFDELLENGHLRSKKELKDRFKELGIGDEELIFSCGSGMTSCILLLASHQIQENKTWVYDGSWTDWGSDSKMPISKINEE